MRPDPRLSKPETFAEASYKCKRCKDVGWLEMGDEGRYGACKCKLDRDLRAAIEDIEGRCLRFKELTLDTYHAETTSQRAALTLCKRFVEGWPLNKRGILLCGSVGIGKTGLLWATAKACAWKTYTPPTWEMAADLLSKIRHTYNDSSGGDTEYRIVDRFSRAALLLLDDLGVEKDSEWADGIFFRLLGERHLRKLPTLISTNWTDSGLALIDEEYHGIPLEDRIGTRLYSRLHECVEIFEMTGNDRRRT